MFFFFFGQSDLCGIYSGDPDLRGGIDDLGIGSSHTWYVVGLDLPVRRYCICQYDKKKVDLMPKRPKVGDRVLFNGHLGTVIDIELRYFVTMEFDSAGPSPMSNIDATRLTKGENVDNGQVVLRTS